jgi:ubiquinone/menaquinone biosynthesis C-methylase UbiE
MTTVQEATIAAYLTDEAVEKYSSVYRLFPAEKVIVRKYWRPGDRVLDLACGAGRTTLRLHEMGFSVRGIDVSEPMIRFARRRFPYLDLIVGSYLDIPEPDESFDHVLISFNGLDYAHPESNRLAAIRECHRVLRRGGTLVFSSHNLKSIHVSPWYLEPSLLLWRVRHTLDAFWERAYLREGVQTTYYAAPRYVIHQVENEGFRLLDMIGVRGIRNHVLNRYLSPSLHYVFQKTREDL